MISETDKQEILRTFPNIELSYATITHKNVFSSDLVSAIPEGEKFFCWFITKNQKQVTSWIKINQNTREVIDIYTKEMETTENADLYKGSVFYGTIFEYNGYPFFSTEDVLHLEGKNVTLLGLVEKYKKLHILLKKQTFQNLSYNNKTICLGIPLIFNNFSREMNNVIQKLPYKIREIHFHKAHKPRNYFFMKYTYKNTLVPTTNGKKDVIFNIKADLQNDIYHLYALDESTGKEYLHDVGYIPDYKTSVTMNSIFRTIKENINLDALEESDDEDEFQNENIDKYVDLKKSYYMMCAFNYKFKKWMPLKVKENATIKDLVKRNDLLRLEKNRY